MPVLTLFLNEIATTFLILGGVILFFGIIVLVIILVKRNVPMFQTKKEEIDEDVALQEEMDRVLVPIEDEETIEEIEKIEKDEKK